MIKTWQKSVLISGLVVCMGWLIFMPILKTHPATIDAQLQLKQRALSKRDPLSSVEIQRYHRAQHLAAQTLNVRRHLSKQALMFPNLKTTMRYLNGRILMLNYVDRPILMQDLLANEQARFTPRLIRRAFTKVPKSVWQTKTILRRYATQQFQAQYQLQHAQAIVSRVNYRLAKWQAMIPNYRPAIATQVQLTITAAYLQQQNLARVRKKLLNARVPRKMINEAIHHIDRSAQFAHGVLVNRELIKIAEYQH